jgi:hypothetical protein
MTRTCYNQVAEESARPMVVINMTDNFKVEVLVEFRSLPYNLNHCIKCSETPIECIWAYRLMDKSVTCQSRPLAFWQLK